MRYDIYLISAQKDLEKAELILRRLRALKFKVRLDKKREHTTPTPKDYRDADQSQSVLVLWSKAACDQTQQDSDWVHALAHHARSKPGVLLQGGLDKTVPDEPFAEDERYALSGLGPRKLVNGFYDLVDELGRRDGRKDLRDWMDLKVSDKAGKDAWKAAHPTDPLAVVPKPKTTTAKTSAPATSAATASTAPKPALVQARSPLPPLRPPQAPSATSQTGSGSGWSLLVPVIAGIALLLLFSWVFRSKAGLPATAYGGQYMGETCPPGQIPEELLSRPLEPGPIIDDTEEDPDDRSPTW